MPTQDSNSSADMPVVCHIDGSFSPIDLVRRLTRGGLQLKTSQDGSVAVIVKAEKDVIDKQRDQVFLACGVITAVRLALVSRMEDDESALEDALRAAWKILDDVASALE